MGPHAGCIVEASYASSFAIPTTGEAHATVGVFDSRTLALFCDELDKSAKERHTASARRHPAAVSARRWRPKTRGGGTAESGAGAARGDERRSLPVATYAPRTGSSMARPRQSGSR